MTVAATASSRDLLHALINATRDHPFSRCVYCGQVCYGRSCFAHKDLPQLERDSYSTRDGGSVLGESAAVARRESL